MSSIFFLDLLEVLEIHDELLRHHGGQTGVRDAGLLQSALAMPMAGSGGTLFHVDVYEMAAAYLFHIIKNHPFLDGNKRTALACALVFLDLNGLAIDAAEADLYEMTMAAAEGRINKEQIAVYFRSARFEEPGEA